MSYESRCSRLSAIPLTATLFQAIDEKKMTQTLKRTFGKPMTAFHTDEINVITRIRNGDSDAFREILDRWGDYGKRIVARHVPRQDIEDVMQDVFLKTYRSITCFRGESPFKGWLASITVRTCCDYWRSTGRIKLESLPEPDDRQGEWVRSVIQDRSQSRFTAEENRYIARDTLDRVTHRLPGEDRIVLDLIYIEERSVKETAQLLGWSVTKTKMKAFRARKRLRKLLENLVREN